jgi:outer membrane protein OmpA-like peptidoglycan-associated protein
MKKHIQNLAAVCLTLIFGGSVSAIDLNGYNELTTVMDSASVMEAAVFAPKTFEKASRNYLKAKEAVEANKKQKSINKHVAEAREYVENALKAAEVARLSLQEYLEPREKARQAQAFVLVPRLYHKAEEQFLKATTKVESGDVRGGLKEAAKSSQLFDHAELEAIRADILGAVDVLIQKATADDAPKYAPSTLDKAYTARTKADAIITNDRYNREAALVEAARAQYRARHASNIALSVRSLNRNDQAWEKLMLLYEIQMDRIGVAVGLEHLPFDDGPFAAADTLIAHVTNLQGYSEHLEGEAQNLSSSVSESLRKILQALGEPGDESDPIKLVRQVSESMAGLSAENSNLRQQIHASDVKLTALSEEHDEIAAELMVRLERDEKLRSAKKMLNPSEGEVLFNSSNDIVLRLSGLSFDVGKSNIKDAHVGLLEKVRQVIEMFPEARLVIEGHTDASGDPSANILLSEKRAFAVMQYLRQSLLISADRIQAIGYGADHPIASNQTADGRSKNRRIDVLIMQ